MIENGFTCHQKNGRLKGSMHACAHVSLKMLLHTQSSVILLHTENNEGS